jgi:diguanylate cyclase (GGDEF)-like protein
LAALSGRNLRFAPDWLAFSISWIAGLMVLGFFFFRRIWLGILAFVIMFFGLFIGAQFLFGNDTVLNPFILLLGPTLGVIAGIVSDLSRLLWENQGLQKKVIHDKMTGLYNYDFLRMRLDEEWKRSQKLKLPVTIVMTDLDRFKSINDTLGHEEGNRMILRAAAVIKESVRGYDVVSRYGGDEFVILLWRTSMDEAKAYRQRLRAAYEAMAQKLEGSLRSSSISIGVATLDPEVDPNYPGSPQEIIEIADKDLFLDKESRRQGGHR